MLEELKTRIEDEHRRALLDAYLKTPTAQSIADEALRILAGPQIRINQLKVRGFRAFNEEQIIDLSDPIVVFEELDGSGKISLAEAIEWLLYGKTLKRIKGEELSKREYARCYRDTHFIRPGLPFVEANITDIPGAITPSFES